MRRIFSGRTLYGIITTLLMSGTLPGFSSSPDDSTRLGWQVGLSTGFFIPSAHTASFYNGKEGNENTIGYILNNKYYYEEIFSLLEASDTFMLRNLPTDMRYNNSMMVGFTFRNKYRKDFSWYFSIRQVRLKSADFYTLEVDPLKHIATEPDIRRFMIWGEEDRHHFDFGVTWEFFAKVPAFVPTFDLGLTVTNAKVKTHKIFVNEKEFSLINVYGNQPYIPGSGQQTFLVEQGGIGFGGYVTLGGRYNINSSFSLDPSVQLYVNTIHLKPYQQPRLHLLFNLTFSVNNLLMLRNEPVQP